MRHERFESSSFLDAVKSFRSSYTLRIIMAFRNDGVARPAKLFLSFTVLGFRAPHNATMVAL